MDPRDLKSLRTKWRERAPTRWSFFCPLCRVTRQVSCSARPTWRHMGQVALTSVVFTLLTWNWFEWRGIVSFVPFWTIFEIIYRSKLRVALHCPNCGFDPYLYLVDIQRARTEIENHWRKKFSEKGVPFPERDRPSTLKEAGQRKPSEPSQPIEGEGEAEPEMVP